MICNLDLTVTFEKKSFTSAQTVLLLHRQHIRTWPQVFPFVNVRIYICSSPYLHQFISVYPGPLFYTSYSISLFVPIRQYISNKTRLFILAH